MGNPNMFEPERVKEEVRYNLRKALRLDSGFDKFSRNATAILAGLAMFSSIMLYHAVRDEYNRMRSILPQVQEERVSGAYTNIDGDKLSDLVVGNRILLADRTDEGIAYRPLRDSDIYRIR